MGKKYIIEIPEDKIADFVGSTHFLMPYMMAGHIGHHDTGLPIAPYTEPDMEQVRKEVYDKCMNEAEDLAYKLYSPKIDEAYQRGLNDAWEAARKVTYVSKYGGYGDCLDKVFNRHDGTEWDVFDYSATEAIEEIQAYEQAQKEIRAKEIHAADVVQNKKDPYIKVFVTTVYNGKFSGVALTTVAGHCNRGNMFSYQDAERWEKVSGDWWRCLNEDDSE